MEGNPFEAHLSNSNKLDAMDIEKLVQEFGSNFTVTSDQKTSPTPIEKENQESQKDVISDPFKDDSIDDQESEEKEEKEEEESNKSETRTNHSYSGTSSGQRKRRRESPRKRTHQHKNMDRNFESKEYERVGWTPPKIRQQQQQQQQSLSIWDMCLRVGLVVLGCMSLCFIVSVVVLYQNVNNGFSLGASSAKAINDVTESVLNNPVIEKLLSCKQETNDPVKELNLPPDHHLLLKQGVYELWTEPHNTTSYPLDYTLEIAKSTTRILKAAFWHHMTTTPDGPKCMCMHHLHIDRLPLTPHQLKNGHHEPILYQLCGVYNEKQRQIYMMANPRQSGGSRLESVILMEHSVSCPLDHWRQVTRTESLFLDWIDPFTEETMYREFKGDESYCMQLALEEMATPGNTHCQTHEKKKREEEEEEMIDVNDIVIVQTNMDADVDDFKLTNEQHKKHLEENAVPVKSV